MIRITTTILAVASVFTAVACNKQNDRPASDYPVTSYEERKEDEMRPASRTASAAESITEARCAREQRCENVGPDKKYSSAADCSARIRNDWKDELNTRECPGGIDQKELDECLAAVRAEDCNSPFDTLGRLSECTAGPICRGD